jgi:hypothetical protein
MKLSSNPKPASRLRIHVPGNARLAPPLDGDSADKTRTPPALIAERLQLPGGLEEIDHRPSFANHSCISTNPEETRGGLSRSAWLKAHSSVANTFKLSAC